jgi:hypothetical protein
MHLVTRHPTHDAQGATGLDLQSVFIGTSLVVLFARGEDIERVRTDGSGLLALTPPFHVGEEDAYLLLPDDIGEEIVDILRDGDFELLQEALRDGLLVQGEINRNPRGPGMVLDATCTCSPLTLLTSSNNHAASVRIGAGADALRQLNTLPHLQCTTLSALADDAGLEAMLRTDAYLGLTWRPPASVKSLADIEPTYAWSRRISETQVGIELALFQEDDELVAVLRPAMLAL